MALLRKIHLIVFLLPSSSRRLRKIAFLLPEIFCLRVAAKENFFLFLFKVYFREIITIIERCAPAEKPRVVRNKNTACAPW